MNDIGFVMNTYISTDQGRVPIESICSKNSIHECNIHSISTQKIENDLVYFEKDALGIDEPEEPILMGKKQLIFFEEKWHHAEEFVNNNNVKYVNKINEILYQVNLPMQKKIQSILVHGIVCHVEKKEQKQEQPQQQKEKQERQQKEKQQRQQKEKQNKVKFYQLQQNKKMEISTKKQYFKEMFFKLG